MERTHDFESVGVGVLLEVFWSIAVFAPGAHEVASQVIDENEKRHRRGNTNKDWPPVKDATP